MWPALMAAARPAIGAVLGRMASGGLGSWAARIAPDAGFALFSALAAPKDTSLSDRALMGLEGFALNSLGSGIGEFGGGLIGREVARRKGLGLMGRRAARMIDTGIGWGGNAGSLAANVLPLPFTNSVYEKAFRREQDRQMAMQGLEDADMYADLGGFAALAAQPMFDPRLLT